MDDSTTSAPKTSPDLPEKEVARLQAKCGLQHYFFRRRYDIFCTRILYIHKESLGAGTENSRVPHAQGLLLFRLAAPIL